jgi:hypothetical protein
VVARITRSFLAAALMSALAAGAVVAQGTPAPSLVAPSSASFVPAKRAYVARLFSEGQAHRLGWRSLELTPTTFGGAPAWLLVDSREIGKMTLAESLYVAKATLSPLHRAVHTADQDIITHYTADSIVTTFTGEGGAARVALPGEANLIGNLYWIEPLFASLPLATGWTGSATTLFVGPKDHARVEMQLAVTGEEKIEIPDGFFDCWIVTLNIGNTAEQFWVRKADRLVLKESTPVAGIPGASVELLLGLGEGQGKK